MMSAFRRMACFVLILFVHPVSLRGESPLAPVKTESPRATMQTFYEAMNEYRRGVEDHDEGRKAAINRAIRTLDLQEVPPLLRKETGREAAIFLKEVIDRIIVLRYDLIPDEETPDLPVRWRLKDTEIIIAKQSKGDREGQYLFSAETVANARDFFEKVETLPYVRGSGGGAGYREPWLQAHVPKSLKREVLGLLGWQWLGILLAIVSGWVVRLVVRRLFHWGGWVVRRTGADMGLQVVEALSKPAGIVGMSAFWYFCLYWFKLEGMADKIFTLLNQGVFSLALVSAFYRLVDVFTNSLQRLSQKNDFLIDQQFVPFLGRSLRVLVVVFGTLIALQNLGINVMSVIAGLGIGGLAFALAAKDTAANLFGTLMIFSDQPFKVGDWIKFGDIEGNVEHVGFRSTRIRTFYNSQISVPNAILANVSIDNMGRREVRRVRTTLKLPFSTPPEQITSFLEGIYGIIGGNALVRHEDTLVTLNEYGDYALVVLVQFFLKVDTGKQEFQEKQRIFLSILELARDLRIELTPPMSAFDMMSAVKK